MAKYTPPVRKSGGGPQGKAVIQVRDREFRVALEEITDDDKVINHVHIMKMSDQTEEMRPLIKPGVYFARISASGDKLYVLRPWEGVEDVKFVGFAHEKDKKPAPKQRIFSQSGKENNITLNCVALLKTRSGYTFPYYLRYPFVEIKDDSGKAIAGYGGNFEWQGKITAVGKAAEFFETIGVWNAGPMEYKDNLLPILEARALRANVKFKVLVKKGQIDSIFGADMVESETLPEE